MATNLDVKITIDSGGAIAQVDGFTKAIDNSTTAIDNNQKELADLQKQLRTLNPNSKQWQEAAKEFEKLGGNTKVLNAGLKDIAVTLSKLEPNSAEWKELNDVYTQLGGSASDLANQRLKVLGEQLKSMTPDSDQYAKLKTEFENLGGSLPVEPVKSLKTQIKELEKTLMSGQIPEGTEQFEQMRKKLTDLKDQAADFKEEIGAGVGNSVEQASGNFGLLKDRLSNLDFDGSAKAMQGLTNSVKSFSPKEFIAGMKAMGTAFMQFTSTLLANPIVATLVAISLAVAGIYLAFKVQEKNVQESTDRMLSNIDRLSEERKRKEKIELAEVSNNEKRKFEIKQQAIKNEISDNARKILAIYDQEKQGVDMTEEQFKQLTDARKKQADLQVDLELLKIERINQLNAAQVDQERRYLQIGMTEREKAYDDLDNMQEDQMQKLIQLGADEQTLEKQRAIWKDEARKLDERFAKEDSAKAKERLDKKTSEEEKNAQELKAIKDKYNETLKEQQNEQLAQEEMIAERIRKSRMSADDIQIENIRDEYFELIELAKQYGQDYVALEQERDRKITDIQQKGINERRKLQQQMMMEQIAEEEMYAEMVELAGMTESERSIRALKDEYFEKIEMAKQYGNDVTALTQERDRKISEIESAERLKRTEQQVELAKSGLQMLSDLSDLFANKSEKDRRTAFERNKAMNIGIATADTYMAAQKAYASQMQLTPDSPIRATLAAAAAVTSGLIRVRKIAQTKYESSGASAPSGGGGDVAGGSSPMGAITSSVTPQLSPLELDFLKNKPDQIKPAYVLAGAVSSAQEVRNKVENLSRLN